MTLLLGHVFASGLLCEPKVVLRLAGVLCALFLAVVFLQSGYDKARNFQGNLDYFKSQFANTPLKSVTGILLVIVTLLELFSGVISLAGAVLPFIAGSFVWIGAGCALSAFTLICLLAGQRIAKDYAGAASLTGYFIVAIIGIVAYALSATVEFC